MGCGSAGPGTPRSTSSAVWTRSRASRSAAALTRPGHAARPWPAALTLCPRDEWIGVDELFAAMRSAGAEPDVARSERGLWKLYLGDPEYGSLGYDGYPRLANPRGPLHPRRSVRVRRHARPARRRVRSPAQARDDFQHMWGADWIDALSRYDGLLAVRLTPLGAYAAGSDYQVRARAARRREPHPPGARQPRHRRHRHSRRQTGSCSTHSPPAPPTRCGRLTTASLMAAVDAGRSPGELASIPGRARRARHPVHSPAVSSPTSRRAPGRSAISVPSASSNAPTPRVATLLSRDRTMRGLCSRIGERHLLLEPASEPKARAALRKLGYPLGPATR